MCFAYGYDERVKLIEEWSLILDRILRKGSRGKRGKGFIAACIARDR